MAKWRHMVPDILVIIDVDISLVPLIVANYHTLLGAMPESLPEPMLTFWRLDSQEKTSVAFKSNAIIFLFQNVDNLDDVQYQKFNLLYAIKINQIILLQSRPYVIKV